MAASKPLNKAFNNVAADTSACCKTAVRWAANSVAATFAERVQVAAWDDAALAAARLDVEKAVLERARASVVARLERKLAAAPARARAATALDGGEALAQAVRALVGARFREQRDKAPGAGGRVVRLWRTRALRAGQAEIVEHERLCGVVGFAQFDAGEERDFLVRPLCGGAP